ncbi:MAG: hypothetical protein F6J93_03930 [Oscillatoria sp. SIO1A7]|nr:hypothetical protein [Oscillatoria sp. SIO1A7]
MSLNEIVLEPEDWQWLEMTAKENQTTIAALVGQAVKQMRQKMLQEEPEVKHPSFEVLLEQTRGIWKGEDGLEYQQSIRREWA